MSSRESTEQEKLIASFGGLHEYRKPTDKERARLTTMLEQIWRATDSLRSQLDGPEDDPPPLLFLEKGGQEMEAVDLGPIINHPDRGMVAFAIQGLVAQVEPLPLSVTLSHMIYMRQVSEQGNVGERVEFYMMRAETIEGHGAMLTSAVKRSAGTNPAFAEPEIIVFDGQSKGGGVLADFYRGAFDRVMRESAGETKQ